MTRDMVVRFRPQACRGKKKKTREHPGNPRRRALPGAAHRQTAGTPQFLYEKVRPCQEQALAFFSKFG